MQDRLLPLGSKVVIYCRKSTDGEDRQVASLERQKDEIFNNIVIPNKLDVLKAYYEKRTAKAPGRPIFNEMMDFVEKNDVKYILCFVLNRLARNPYDSGALVWILQNANVRFVTPARVYTEDDSILVQMEFAVGNQFILDLRRQTISGLRKKLDAGIAPIRAPIGYINNMALAQGMRNILPDPDRFHLVRKMWDMLLSRQYRPSEIYEIATKEWNLTTKPALDVNGNLKSVKPFSPSQMYEMFHNLFYTGQFEYSDKIYQGNHKPMITMGEFEEAQRILGGKNNRRPHLCEFAYTGEIRCECGGMITAHERFRNICPGCKHKYNALTNKKCPKCGANSPENHWYTCLYHCTQQSKKNGCHSKSINLTELEKQIDQTLSTMNIDLDFLQWGLSKLRRNAEDEQAIREQGLKQLTERLHDIERQDTILKNRFFSSDNEDNSLLTTDEFKERRELLVKERKAIEDTLKTNSQAYDGQVNTITDAYDFIQKARYWLEHGSKKERRLILTTISSYPTLLDGKILIDLNEEYDCLRKGKEVCEQTMQMFEPNKKTDGPVEYGDWMLKNPIMGG